ncbi:GDSL esterase/lipase At5g14450 [Lycium barbarum]|uniref:GDSL esterase/lipase At5g14450 n=1 Tax=Lycium barbarum TaxID=112863 RepID=UPI00293F6755|nr:GDSL esterase/lipase At5g14450 [Lycium barbarum]
MRSIAIMEGARVMFLLLLSLILLTPLKISSTVEVATNAKPPCNFPAIYNFGDSNSDTGGISAAFEPIQAPYGESFFRKPAGRFSDGRLLIDFIAEHMSLPYLSPYLDSIGSNFRHGANFATGGSTIRRQNETIFQSGISPFFLDVQIVHFHRFKSRTEELYRQEKNKLPRPREFSHSLYTIDIGQTDLAVGFRQMSNIQLRAAIPDIINHFSAAVTRLYQQGARAFWIHNIRPIGCLPTATLYLRNPKPGVLDNYGCLKSHNNLALEFNRQLKARIGTLRAELGHAAITYVDVYAAKYELISNAKSQGFMEPQKICCGVHEGNAHVWCGQKGIVRGAEVFGGACANPSGYISWDGVHYSQAANHWIANHILNGSFSDPPIPITHACHKRLHH